MKSWEKNIRKVIPYVPGEQPQTMGMIKLNTNENPYPPAPKVKEILEGFQAERFKLYPDPTEKALISRLADYYQVKEEQVFAGIGSDDVLAMAFLTFFNGKEPILFPDITYSFYDVWADLFGITYHRVPLTEDFRLDPNDYKRINGGIIFPNPNAPTGIYEDLSIIEQILKENQESIVIIDEAYIDFAGSSAVELIDTYENLVVVQTFSKSRSMAGVRIGFAIGNAELISYLNNAKNSFNSYTLNELSMNLGVAALEDREYFEDTVKKIIETREWTKHRLTELGFSFPNSRGNFIFAKHDTLSAEEIYMKLREKNIFVRYFKKNRIDQYLRITIGTQEEMVSFIKALKDIVIFQDG
jgi:histidinol-phosphate aminotransferase